MSVTNKTILEVETIPRVEIDFMNNTHFEEIEMVRKLGELIITYQETDTDLDTEDNRLSQSLQEWLEHTVAHFERENQLMQETGFPAYAIHSNEHESALNRIKAVITSWETNKDIELIANYVFTLWPEWFNGHVNTMDMMTAKFAVMNGFNEEQQKAS